MSRVGIVTYGHQFAAKWGRKARNIIRDRGHVFNTTLDPDKDAANEFETLQGGSLLCTGVGGVLTGHGFDLMLSNNVNNNGSVWNHMAYTRQAITHAAQIAKMEATRLQGQFGDAGLVFGRFVKS